MTHKLMLLFLFLISLASCGNQSIQLESAKQGLSPDGRVSEESIWNDQFFDRQSKSLKTFSKQRKESSIEGVCIIRNPKNTVNEFCNKIELILTDRNKKIIARTKTLSNGSFRFENAKKGTYLLDVNDSKYEKVSNRIYVSPGAEVLIHLLDSK